MLIFDTRVGRLLLKSREAAKRIGAAAWLALMLCALHGVAAEEAQAQDNTANLDEVEAGGTAYYTFVRSGEVRIEVLALGSVRSPGIYAVGLGMTLDQLLALTGGASISTRSGDERINVLVRLYRQEEGQRRLVYEEPMTDVLSGTDEYPVLQEGDALMVETVVQQKFFTTDRVLRFLSAAGTLFLIVLRLRDAN